MFYDRFISLCEQKGISPSAAAEATGRNRTSVIKWKNGSVPSGESLGALASYFDVTIDYLLGNTNEKKPPEQSRGPSEEEIKFALFKGDKEISDKAFQEVKDFAEYVRQKYKKEKEE